MKRVISLYKSLVRPHLEYCTPVQNPHILKDIKLLAVVQRLVESSEDWNYDDSRHFRTIRYQEYSFSRLFVPWNIRSHDRTFVLGTIRSLELSFPGGFVPWNIRSLDRSFPGTVVPWTFRSWTIHSRYRMLCGKFIPLTTTVAIHGSLCT